MPKVKSYEHLEIHPTGPCTSPGPDRLQETLRLIHTEIHWIVGIEAGRLGTMARPRGGDWLEDWFKHRFSSRLETTGLQVIRIVYTMDGFTLGEGYIVIGRTPDFTHTSRW